MPDFLLIGAAKAGTTSLFDYVCQHPKVYAPSLKEPNFFALPDRQDEPGLRLPGTGPGDQYVGDVVCKVERYRALFQGAKHDQLTSEASVSTLFAPGAAERISAFAPRARLVVLLRDPVERAWSQYLHHVRDSREPLDFASAIRAEETRMAAGWEYSWAYVAGGRYAEQLARFFAVFPSEQIGVWLFEDLRQDPARITLEVLAFVGIADKDLAGWRPDISHSHNRSGLPRGGWLGRAVLRPSPLRTWIRNHVPRAWGHAAMERLRSLVVKRDKPAVPADVAESLRAEYADDIVRLEGMIGRNLSAWKPRSRQRATS